MKIVIDIPNWLYNAIMECKEPQYSKSLGDAVRDGTPLPKGHGRLGDLDKVADGLEALRDNWNYYGNEYESGIYTGYDYSLDEVMDAQTIIEADTESEE